MIKWNTHTRCSNTTKSTTILINHVNCWLFCFPSSPDASCISNMCEIFAPNSFITIVSNSRNLIGIRRFVYTLEAILKYSHPFWDLLFSSFTSYSHTLLTHGIPSFTLIGQSQINCFQFKLLANLFNVYKSFSSTAYIFGWIGI